MLNPATGAHAPQHSFTAGSHVVLEITFAPGCGPAVVFCLSPRPMELREVRACVLQQGLVLCHSVGIRRKVRGKIEGRDIDVLQVINCQCEKESTLALRACACACACACAFVCPANNNLWASSDVESGIVNAKPHLCNGWRDLATRKLCKISACNTMCSSTRR